MVSRREFRCLAVRKSPGSVSMAGLKPLGNDDESNVGLSIVAGSRPGRRVIIARRISRGRMALVAARQGW